MGKTTTPALNVLIIGCGNIAGGFDIGRGSTALPQTHAGAFTLDPRFTIQACVEPDKLKREAFSKYWGIPQHFASIDDMKQTSLNIDIVSICSPTHLHKSHVNESLRFNPRLIFCEKPISPTVSDSQIIADLCAKSGTTLCINHNRRWDPKIIEIKAALSDNKYGALRSVVGYYNKGVLNNGSHLIDMIHFLLGDLTVVATCGAQYDFHDNDPSITALLKSQTGIPVHLVTGNANDYSLFQLQLIFADRLLTVEAGGQTLLIQEAVDNPIFSGYKILNEGVRSEGLYGTTMTNAINNIYSNLTQGQALASTGQTALAAQRICEEIVTMYMSQQQTTQK